MTENKLKTAAENAYNAWMGGTINDVHEAMKELGKVIEGKKQYFVIVLKTYEGLQLINDGKIYDNKEECIADAKKFDCNAHPAFVAIINQFELP